MVTFFWVSSAWFIASACSLWAHIVEGLRSLWSLSIRHESHSLRLHPYDTRRPSLLILSHCCCSVTKLCLILCYPMDCSMAGLPASWSLPKFMFIESMMLSNHLIFCRSLLRLLSIFPAPGSFPMSWLFASGGQIIQVSASASVLPMNIQSSFPFGLTVLISLLSKGLSRVFSCTTLWKHQLSHLYLTTGKTIALTMLAFVGKLMSLLFNTLSRFVIAFVSGSKHLVISWLQSHPQWFWTPK